MAVVPSLPRVRQRPAPLQTRFPRRRGFQRAFFCLCGRPLGTRLVVCRICAWQVPYSARYFGGHRAQILERDGKQCRICGSAQTLHVHHRHPGVHEPEWLVTLCAGCHARVHRLQALRYWLPPVLLQLWKEQHPHGPQQVQFNWDEAIAA